MQCQLQKSSDNRAVCVRCGRGHDISKSRDFTKIRRECTGKMLAGDMVKYLANVIGFRKQCGGCTGRQRGLNKIDRKLRNKLAAGWEAMSRLGRRG